MDERGSNMTDAGNVEMGALKPCISYQYIVNRVCIYQFIVVGRKFIRLMLLRWMGL